MNVDLDEIDRTLEDFPRDPRKKASSIDETHVDFRTPEGIF